MEKSAEYLRVMFKAETNIEIGASFSDWHEYAVWLEKLSVKEINNNLIKENEHLSDKPLYNMPIADSISSFKCSFSFIGWNGLGAGA